MLVRVQEQVHVRVPAKGPAPVLLSLRASLAVEDPTLALKWQVLVLVPVWALALSLESLGIAAEEGWVAVVVQVPQLGFASAPAWLVPPWLVSTSPRREGASGSEAVASYRWGDRTA